jgi:hypothetical protein
MDPDVVCWAPLSGAPPKLMLGVEPPPKVKGAAEDVGSPLPKLNDDGAEYVPSDEKGFLMAEASVGPAEKVNEALPVAPKMDEPGCEVAG